jgi:hypothetical protein
MVSRMGTLVRRYICTKVWQKLDGTCGLPCARALDSRSSAQRARSSHSCSAMSGLFTAGTYLEAKYINYYVYALYRTWIGLSVLS